MAGRLIDKLKAKANLVPVKHVVKLHDGSEIEFWSKPLTAATRDRAKKNARSDDPSAFALQLLISEAKDEDGRPLFNPGDAAELRNSVRSDDLDAMLLSILGAGEDDDEEYDMKSDSD